MNDTISNTINKLIQNNNSSTDGDLQQQELINKALISAGLPQNKLNDLIEQARDKLMCNSDCQKKRKGDAYKQKWDLAKKNYEAAPEEIKQAEKNYYIYDKGYAAYKNMLYDRYAKTASEFKTTSMSKHAAIQDDLQEQINNYEEGTIYLKRMNELLQIKLSEKEQLRKNIDEYISFTETNGRKVIYEDREREWLTTYRQIIIYILFTIAIIYVIFSQGEKYKKMNIWIIISMFIVFPYFIVNIMVKLLYSFYNYVNSFTKKTNVYTHL